MSVELRIHVTLCFSTDGGAACEDDEIGFLHAGQDIVEGLEPSGDAAELIFVAVKLVEPVETLGEDRRDGDEVLFEMLLRDAEEGLLSLIEQAIELRVLVVT